MPGRAMQIAATRKSAATPERGPGLPGPLFKVVSGSSCQARIPPDRSIFWPSGGTAGVDQGLLCCSPTASGPKPDAGIPGHAFVNIPNPALCTASNNRCRIIARCRSACRWSTPRTETDKRACSSLHIVPWRVSAPTRFARMLFRYALTPARAPA
jgi:hypothetical protein